MYYVFDDGKNKYEGMTREQIIAAIAQATGTTPADVDNAFITKLLESNGNKSIGLWVGTQAEYNAIAEPDENTLYCITDPQEVNEMQNQINQLQAEVNALVAENTSNATGYKIEEQTVEEQYQSGESVIASFTLPENAKLLEVSHRGMWASSSPDFHWNTEDFDIGFTNTGVNVFVNYAYGSGIDVIQVKIVYAYPEAVDLSELTDIRVGYDGTEYETAGEAVREQISALHDAIEDLEPSGEPVQIDTTLTEQGAAADAKAAGDAIKAKFTLPANGANGQALLSNGSGGAVWGDIGGGGITPEAERDVYGFTDADYTAVDITDQFTPGGGTSGWDVSTNQNLANTLSPVFQTPQKIVIKNNRTDLDLGKRMTRFLNGQDASTATVATFDTENEKSFRWQCGVAAESEETIYTHEFGRAGFEYMQIKWSGGTFASWLGKFQVIAYYTNKRSTYENEIPDNDGFEHDVKMSFAAAVPGNTKVARANLLAIVPFYPNRKYTIKGGHWVNVAAVNINTYLLYDEAIFDRYYTALMPQSAPNLQYYQPPIRKTSGTVVQSGASNGGKGIITYVCDDPETTHDYPKYIAFALYSANKPAVSDANITYPYTDEIVSAWMDAAKTALDNIAPWGYITALDELIDRKASECDNFVNPYVYYKDAGSHNAALLSPACPLAGATLTVFGDSICDNYGGHDLTSQYFLSKICREFGMKLDNRAKSGSNMYVTTNAYKNVCGVYMLQEYLDALQAGTIEQSEYILIEFGANAYDSQIGTASDTSADTNTQYGAVKFFIEQLRANSPNSVFGFILPHDVNWGTISTSKQAGVPLARAAIKAVCEEYRVPYFDMYTKSGITADMLSDGVHIGTPQSQNLYYHAARRFVFGL